MCVSVSATTWKRLYLVVTRLLAPLCASLALLFFYDLAATATETDNARVVAKAQRTQRARSVFIIEAKGRYSYREDVSARIFRTIQLGDTLHVSLTPVFTEWKTMEVVRNGTVVAATRGPELSGMGAMGLLLLIGLAAFLPERILFPERLLSAHPRITVLVIAVPVIDFAAVLLGARLVQVWMGHIEKM
jgi:VCBS repeat-containing protein